MEITYRVRSMDELAKYWRERADKAATEVDGTKSKPKRKVAEARADLLAEVADQLSRTVIEP